MEFKNAVSSDVELICYPAPSCDHSARVSGPSYLPVKLCGASASVAQTGPGALVKLEDAAQRAKETGLAQRTVHRRAARFADRGMQRLFATSPEAHRRLAPQIRRAILS